MLKILHRYISEVKIKISDERSFSAFKNIVKSFIIKGLSVLISFVLVPLSIAYLGIAKYGVWVTLGSIISWFSFFDIGLGNGLRNKFAIAKTQGDDLLARKYISTTYAILTVIMLCLILVFMIINNYLNWNEILNAQNIFGNSNELKELSYFVILFFCLNFILKLITTILTADQKPAEASLFDLYSRIIALALIYVAAELCNSSIVLLGVIVSGSQFIVLLTANIWLFNSTYRKYRPSFKLIDFTLSKGLVNLGLNFFLIQIAALFLYQSNIVIISQKLGPEIVAKYSIGYSYYGSLSMIFAIIISPFWSAFTEAWVKDDIKWIKTIIRNLMTVWVGLFVVGLVMIVFSKSFFGFWLGDASEIEVNLSFLILLNVIVAAWNGIFSTLLNGIGKVRMQLWLGLTTAIINIPLSIFLATIYGLEGILIANVLVAIPGLIIYPRTCKKLLS